MKKKAIQSQKINSIKRFFTHRTTVLFIILLLIHIFFRFYQLEERMQFTWDQVDNAWNAKNILIEHHFPLLGMPANQNSGIFIGPAYYYLIAFFYWVFDLDPIAGGIFAGLVSIVSSLLLFTITKKMFSNIVAFFAVFLYATGFIYMQLDRVQWPVNFIPIISLTLMYCVYKILTNHPKFIVLLAAVLGFSFHIHFTSIYYIPILFFVLPFLPRNKKMIKYIVLSAPFFFVWFTPMVIAKIQTDTSGTNDIFSFFNSAYHGIHLRRLLQIAPDAFSEFDKLLSPLQIPFLKFLFLPVFICFYYLKNQTRDKRIIVFLFLLWFFIPWLVLSTYKGVLTDYYFAATRFQAIIIVAYILSVVFNYKSKLTKIVVLGSLAVFSIVHTQKFFLHKEQGLYFFKQQVIREVEAGQEDGQFTYGAPDNYLHYFYTRKLENEKKRP